MKKHRVLANMLESRRREILALARSLGSQKEEPMRMRLKGGRWFANFKNRGKHYGCSLQADASNERQAIINLGKLLECLERGENPRNLNRRFKELLDDYSEWAIGEGEKSELTIRDNNGRLKKNILPAFGKLVIKDICQATIKSYKTDREENGATRSTITKELCIIKDVIALANPAFKLPKFKRWVNQGRKESEMLAEQDVVQVSELILESSEKHGETYQKVFNLMSLTGLSVSDAVNLRRSQITRDGFIQKQRAKSGEKIVAYLCDKAKAILDSIKVTNLADADKFFSLPGNKALSTAIRRSFNKAGIKASAKSLRHYAASILLNKGRVPKDVVALVLGHAPGSKVTGVYLHAHKDTIRQGFKAFDGSQSVAKGLSKSV